ncbi:type IV pilin protein [Archangium lipolyticum]|uniref:type IV pilin protein n=1 Tax=Archangium lipolyticum TaxID=2970465 RepID=UPI00214A56F5|nr:hypothetical protein [Archangium lipolyticum]
MYRLPSPPRGPRGSTLIEVALVLVMLGLLAAIAVPRFLAARSRALQTEARHNLKSWAQAQHAYHQETNGYTQDIRTLGFTVERGNRYAYYFGDDSKCELRETATLPPMTGSVECIGVDVYVHGLDRNDSKPAPRRFKVIHLGPGDATNVPGISGPCPGCNTDAVAVGQLDDEPHGVDTWYIATENVSIDSASDICGTERGDVVPAKTPINTYDDIECDI